MKMIKKFLSFFALCLLTSPAIEAAIERGAEEDIDLNATSIGEKVDCVLFNLKPRIDSLELKVEKLKDRMVYRETMPLMSHMMHTSSLYDSSRTASTSSSGSSSPIESL